jgi:hypothetical protein
MFSGPAPNVKLEQLTGIFNELNEVFQDYLLLQTKELLKIQKKSNTEAFPAARRKPSRQ